jgi:hypothetical protein
LSKVVCCYIAKVKGEVYAADGKLKLVREPNPHLAQQEENIKCP